ncbi:YjfB family protein [Clostridium sp.]
MDIAALSKVMTQPKVQECAGKVEMETAMNVRKENGSTLIEKIQNVAIDTNLGRNLDTIAKKSDG